MNKTLFTLALAALCQTAAAQVSFGHAEKINSGWRFFRMDAAWNIGEQPGCECFASWDEFIVTCRPDEEVFIIGGATLYRDLLPHADRLCLTEVQDTPAEADTFFPDYSDWKEQWREDHPVDDRHAFAYSFVDYVR